MRVVADADENTVGYIILHWLTGQSFIHSFSSAVVDVTQRPTEMGAEKTEKWKLCGNKRRVRCR